MAAKMKKPGPAAAKKPVDIEKAGLGINKGVLLMVVAALVPFSLPTVTILAVTMLPTFTAYFAERGPNRYAWLCVGGLNFSGVVPFLFTLWFGVHTMDEAFRMLSEASVLLWGYTTAAFGWVIYNVTPPIVSSYLAYSAERRITSLKSVQKRLIEDWGDDVARK